VLLLDVSPPPSSSAFVKRSCSYAVAVHYVVIALRMPDYLGHLTLRVFSDIESGMRVIAPLWTQWTSFMLRIAYVVVMQLFFRLIAQVRCRCHAHHAHPALLSAPSVRVSASLTRAGPTHRLLVVSTLPLSLSFSLGDRPVASCVGVVVKPWLF
jgi:hypothetical protein